MSVASKVGQVIFSQKSGVYMPAIMCDKRATSIKSMMASRVLRPT